MDSSSNNIAIGIHNVTKKHEMVFRSGSRVGAFLYGNLQMRHNIREFLALDDVSFDVEKGKLTVLIGENGAGKSTLLQAIAGITSIDSGEINVNGKVGALLELGFGFHPDLNGYENCYLQGAMLELQREQITEMLPSILDFAGIGDAMDRPVRFYSKGMYARLAFSLSIHVDPDILLIDEIIAVGDVDFQEKSMRAILELRDAGKAILLVSHHVPMLKQIGENAIWLERGKVVEYGPVEAVIHRYQRKVNLQLYDRGEEQRKEFNETTLAENPLKKSRHEHAEKIMNEFDGEIKTIEMLGTDGKPHTVFQPFDDVTIRASYSIKNKIPGMILKCLILREDGVIIHEYISEQIDKIENWNADGQFSLKFPDFPLAFGNFEAIVGFFHVEPDEKDVRLCEQSIQFKLDPPPHSSQNEWLVSYCNGDLKIIDEGQVGE